MWGPVAVLVQNAGVATKIGNLKALLDTLKAHKILPIARIVVFKDSVTARVHPEWTIRKTDGSVWRDKKGLAWVNPYHHELWDYNLPPAPGLVDKPSDAGPHVRAGARRLGRAGSGRGGFPSAAGVAGAGSR